jgi:hypothetical protein
VLKGAWDLCRGECAKKKKEKKKERMGEQSGLIYQSQKGPDLPVTDAPRMRDSSR